MCTGNCQSRMVEIDKLKSALNLKSLKVESLESHLRDALDKLALIEQENAELKTTIGQNENSQVGTDGNFTCFYLLQLFKLTVQN